jgi:hypothetical protein
MTIQDFKYQLLNYRDKFTSFERYNLESPKRIQAVINEAIAFLNSIKYDEKLDEKVKESIAQLQLAYRHSESFSKLLTSDFTLTNDLAATHPDSEIWYIRVVGTTEAAIDFTLKHIG